MARRKSKRKAESKDESSVVQRLRGKEMDSYLKRFPIVLYRYKANRPGFIFLLVLALIAAVVGLIVWRGVGLNSVWHMLVVGALLTVSLTLTYLVAYWTYYTRIHYVASSDRHLLIGRGSDVVAIDWDALDLNVLNFDMNDDEQFQGVLSLELEGERHCLRLFNGFIVLDNLHTLMLTLLTHVQGDEALEDVEQGQAEQDSSEQSADGQDEASAT